VYLYTMADKITPIKRSKELAPLSHDHHEGLMLVWKIRKGLKHGVATERIVAYCRWYWQYHLAGHFQREEELLPLVMPSNHPLFCQMMEEHDIIKRRVKSLPEDAVQPLELLAQSLNDHIRFEERKLFNEVEKLGTPEQLQKIAEGLNKEDACPDWQDKFWATT